jgi:hypothetical protein
MGEAFCKIPRAIGVMADGTDEDGARAAKMDEWGGLGCDGKGSPSG